jgi:hypothetical protein
MRALLFMEEEERGICFTRNISAFASGSTTLPEQLGQLSALVGCKSVENTGENF